MTLPSLSSSLRIVEHRDPLGRCSWTWPLGSTDDVELLIALRRVLWHGLHNDEHRNLAIEVLHAHPEMLLGSLREWAGLAHALALSACPCQPWPHTLSVEDQKLVDNMNGSLLLGPFTGETSSDSLPINLVAFANNEWVFRPEGHWFVDALLFGDVAVLATLLSIGVDPNMVLNVDEKGLSHDAWGYCMGMRALSLDDVRDQGIQGSLHDVREGAAEVLELCLQHGLNPAAPLDPRHTESQSREGYLEHLLDENPDNVWVRRWLRAMETHRLRKALPKKMSEPQGGKRVRL